MASKHAGGVEEHLEFYVRTFNSGDADAVNRLYTENAVAIWAPGEPLTGRERRASLAEFLTRKPVLTATLRESHVTKDTALLTVDWAMEAVGEDGTKERAEGIGADVLVRDASGAWRYAVNAPYGDPRNAKK
ncbi:YybH family protein [Streptomyces stramineus]|uniref:SnoaL-like domain-containing protein n=1 Tax=Streptomyces stramineus TaxID=173861 RepID=A0ABP3JAE0_9ACTN